MNRINVNKLIPTEYEDDEYTNIQVKNAKREVKKIIDVTPPTKEKFIYCIYFEKKKEIGEDITELIVDYNKIFSFRTLRRYGYVGETQIEEFARENKRIYSLSSCLFSMLKAIEDAPEMIYSKKGGYTHSDISQQNINDMIYRAKELGLIDILYDNEKCISGLKMNKDYLQIINNMYSKLSNYEIADLNLPDNNVKDIDCIIDEYKKKMNFLTLIMIQIK